MYSLFSAMEIETRGLLQHGTMVAEGIKAKLMTNICKKDDVLSHWATVASNWEDNEVNVQTWVKYKQKLKKKNFYMRFQRIYEMYGALGSVHTVAVNYS